MVGKSLAEDLRGQGITVLLLHPGYVRTDMTGHQGQISAQESAEGLYRIMRDKNLQNSGEFWHTNGEALPW
jgi:NAD(P)-dependent dehydrogenase (short-subunit alcohol dehydrogenase family)